VLLPYAMNDPFRTTTQTATDSLVVHMIVIIVL